MKTILYMAMTVNGYVAEKDGSTDFVSANEWKHFSAMVRRAGNMIIGRKTYEIMVRNDEFKRLGDIVVIVISSKAIKTKSPWHHSVTSPKAAVNQLSKMKFDVALIAGGGMLNASFMSAKLVDEVYLDVEPTVLGRGIVLFSGASFSQKLRLLGTKKLSKDELQLHYKVV